MDPVNFALGLGIGYHAAQAFVAFVKGGDSLRGVGLGALHILIAGVFAAPLMGA